MPLRPQKSQIETKSLQDQRSKTSLPQPLLHTTPQGNWPFTSLGPACIIPENDRKILAEFLALRSTHYAQNYAGVIYASLLRVSTENPAGLGEMSQDLKHSIETHTDCMRISGKYMLTYIGSKVFSRSKKRCISTFNCCVCTDLSIAPSSENKVVFNDLTPSVEIFLFQLPSQVYH